MSLTPIDQLRAICLALPEAEERETWGDATFRVRDKIFAMVKQGDGRVSFWCKAPPGSQMILVGADPERFFVPPYVGHKGWVGHADRRWAGLGGGRGHRAAQLPDDGTQAAGGAGGVGAHSGQSTSSSLTSSPRIEGPSVWTRSGSPQTRWCQGGRSMPNSIRR